MNRSITARVRSTSRSRVTVGAASLVLALSFTGCSGAAEEAGDSTAADSTVDAADERTGPPRGGMGRLPGAFGVIAAADSGVLQVQSPMTGQVAVTVTADTEITDQVAGAFADVEVGSCVVVQPADDAETGTTTAESVSISQPGDEGCAAGPGGFGGMRGDRPSGRPSDRPSGFPSGGPSGRPGGGAGFGVTGEVTAVDSGGFTVLARVPGSDGEQENVVSVTGTTTFTTQQAADASALTVARCIRATGETDDTGAVTAEQVSVSDAVDGECVMGGLGRRMGGQGAGS